MLSGVVPSVQGRSAPLTDGTGATRKCAGTNLWIFSFLKNNRSNCGTNALCEAEKPLQVAVERSPALIEFEEGGAQSCAVKGLGSAVFF